MFIRIFIITCFFMYTGGKVLRADCLGRGSNFTTNNCILINPQIVSYGDQYTYYGNNYVFEELFSVTDFTSFAVMNGSKYNFLKGVDINGAAGLVIDSNRYTFLANPVTNYSLGVTSGGIVNISGNKHKFDSIVYLDGSGTLVTMAGNNYTFADGVSIINGAIFNLSGNDQVFLNSDARTHGVALDVSNYDTQAVIQGSNNVFDGKVQISDSAEVLIKGKNHVFNGDVHLYNNAQAVIEGSGHEFKGDIIVEENSQLVFNGSSNTSLSSSKVLSVSFNNFTSDSSTTSIANYNYAADQTTSSSGGAIYINPINFVNSNFTSDNGEIVINFNNVGGTFDGGSELIVTNGGYFELDGLDTYAYLGIVDISLAGSALIKGVSSAQFDDRVSVQPTGTLHIKGSSFIFNSLVEVGGGFFMSTNDNTLTVFNDPLIVYGSSLSVIEGDSYRFNDQVLLYDYAWLDIIGSDIYINNLESSYLTSLYLGPTGLIHISSIESLGSLILSGDSVSESKTRIDQGTINKLLSLNVTVEITDQLNINDYTSFGTNFVIGTPGYVASGNYGLVNIGYESSSTLGADNVTYIFDLSNINVGDEITWSFLDVENGEIVLSDKSNVSVQLFLLGEELLSPSSTATIDLEETATGQIVSVTIVKDNTIRTSSDLFGARVAGYTYNIIEQLLELDNIITNINILHDAINYDQTNNRGNKLSSLYHVSAEMYLLDAYNTSSILIDNLSEAKLVADMSNSGARLFATPMLVHTSVEDQGNVTGHSGYKSFLQVGGVIPVPVSGFSVLVAGSGGYGKLVSNSDINKHDIKVVNLGILAGVGITNNYVDSTLTVGYNYNNYKTVRDITVVNTPALEVVAESDQVVHNISLGADIGYRLDVSGVDVTPSIYYKGGLFMFEDYEEEGNVGRLIVEEIDSIWVSDFGTKLSVTFNNVTSIVPSGHVGIGYKYYDSEDTKSVFIEAKDLDDRLVLDKAKYIGIYLNTGVSLKVYSNEAMWFGASYTGEVMFGKTAHHVAALSTGYQF